MHAFYISGAGHTEKTEGQDLVGEGGAGLHGGAWATLSSHPRLRLCM